MEGSSWLAPGFRTLDGSIVRRRLAAGEGWQIYDCGPGNRLLACTPELGARWVEAGIVGREMFPTVQGDQGPLLTVEGGHGYRVELVDLPDSIGDASDADAFAAALSATFKTCPDLIPGHAIYLERLSRVLPTETVGERIPADRVLGTWVTGGVDVSIFATRRIATLAPWLSEADIVRLQGAVPRPEQKSGASGSSGSAEDSSRSELADIVLPGRPTLAAFFNEHVVDIIRNEERYKLMGLGFPGAVLLHGPPGSGKTFAVERLVDHLGWPCLSIDCSSIASPYIHETGRKIAATFDQAAKVAPALVVIDEIDAFLAAREDGGHAQHRVEEVSEFLRRIPQATKDRVLVIGMTNRISALDPAVVRRGRFDHIIEVGMPSAEEVLAALESLLRSVPTETGLQVDVAAQRLAGRPLSDVGFVVREACRLAVRAQRDSVAPADLDGALERTGNRSEPAPKRRIGFV